MVACSGPLGKLGSDGFPMVLERWHWVVQADHAPAGGRQGVKARPLSLTQGMLGGRTSSQGPLETTGPGCAPAAGRMAEGKAGGAAGLFAKQMQKKFSRAQEKVGSLASPGARAWAEEKGSCCPRTGGQGVGVHEHWPTWERREQLRRQLFRRSLLQPSA